MKFLGIAVTVGLLGSACGASSEGEVLDPYGDEGLAFAEDSVSGVSLACDALIATVLRSGSSLEAEDQTELMGTWVAAAPLVKPPADKYLAIVSGTENSDSTLDLLRQIDDLTYEACGIPVYSAAASMGSGDTAPTYLPCFVREADRASGSEFLFNTVECDTGNPLFLHSDGEWRTSPQPPPTIATTTVPASSTTRVTRPKPIITAPPTTAPPTTAPPTTVDPALPPPTNEVGETIPTEPATTTTTEPIEI